MIVDLNLLPDADPFDLNSGPAFPLTPAMLSLFYKTVTDIQGLQGLYLYNGSWLLISNTVSITYGQTFPDTPYNGQIFYYDNTATQFPVGLYAYISGQWQNLTPISNGTGNILASNIIGLAPSATVDTTDASNIGSGTLNGAVLPAYAGDVTSVNGSNVLTLNSVNPYPGTYAGITVNEKGLVTACGILTSLAGYGIADGVNVAQIGIPNGIAALDSSGKLSANQIPNSLVGAVVYEGVWNAQINSPVLNSGRGTKGNYYIVNVAGATNLDGINNWNIGDIAIFNGISWNQLEGPIIQTNPIPQNAVIPATYGSSVFTPVIKINADGVIVGATQIPHLSKEATSASYEYDTQGRCIAVTSIIHGAAQIETMTYTPNNLVQTLTTMYNSVTIIKTFIYDVNGNVLQIMVV